MIFRKAFQVTSASAGSWSRLLDDDNPIHEAEGGAIHPGPANLAYLISAVLEALPGARLIRVHTRFLAPLVAPCEARVEGEWRVNGSLDGGETLTVTAILLSAGGPNARLEAQLWRPLP